MQIKQIKGLLIMLVMLFSLKSLQANNMSNKLEKDTLLGPMFYTMVPRIFEVSTQFMPNYRIKYSNADDKYDQDYNELINSVNVNLPIWYRKEGWRISALFSYHSYNYSGVETNFNYSDNYNIAGYGLRVSKRLRFANKDWTIGNAITFSAVDIDDFKNTSWVSSITTPLKMENGALILGMAFILNREVKIPVVPIVTYTKWFSKSKGILFSAKLPQFDISTTKIFNSKTFLRGGINMLNQGHYINLTDIPFYGLGDDYKLTKIQLAANSKFERAFYKNIWLGSELGYACNIKSGVREKGNEVFNGDGLKSYGPYFKCSIFLRPLGNKKIK